MSIKQSELSQCGLEALSLLREFVLPGEISDFVEGFGNGHINDTYCLTVTDAAQSKRYILQRINPYVFPQAEAVMENIALILPALKAEAAKAGEDVERHTLTPICCRDGKNYYVAQDKAVWRMYLFIRDSISYEVIESPEQFRQAGAAFGKFQRALHKFPAEQLHETIARFHDTPARYEQLASACQADIKQRAGEEKVGELLRQADRYRYVAAYLMQGWQDGSLPVRVTHNDTKLNNILFDKQTKEPLCVVDLDTVMPGLIAFDFGDAIRAGAVTAEEDEKDLSKMHFVPELYFAFLDGFMEQCGEFLTAKEVESLAYGALILPLETGVRFLTDYLNGDVYFKTAYPEHNLIRAANQFRLVSEIAEQLVRLQTETARRYQYKK